MDPNQNQNEQQKRGFVDGLNKSVSTAKRFNRRYRKGLGAKAALRKQAVKRGAIFLISNPIGWIILLIFFVIILAVLILLVFTGGTSAQPPATVECTTVVGASCQPQGTACPIVNGKQTVPDNSGAYTCPLDASGNAKTCCVPPIGPGWFIPPFACGLTYWGLTYGPFYVNGTIHRAHEPWAVDFNRSPQDKGDPVRASADGTVTYVDTSQGGVIISHSGGYKTWYWHMENVVVRRLQKVLSGQQIGQIDTNGDAFGSHLHFQETLNGNPAQITFYGQPYVTGSLASYLANPDTIPINQVKILPKITGQCP